jgi:hypothetical protein
MIVDSMRNDFEALGTFDKLCIGKEEIFCDERK